jgi:hypothetical protein
MSAITDLKLATPYLDGHDAVSLILDAAVDADESAVPGLVLALASLLHMDERPAWTIIEDVRRGDWS